MFAIIHTQRGNDEQLHYDHIFSMVYDHLSQTKSPLRDKALTKQGTRVV